MFLTTDLPGSGGVLHADPNDFVVEEISAYDPSGEGEHVLVLIEKVGLTTPEAIRRIAQAAGVQEGDVGRAGMKDRHARARQWLSFQVPIKKELPDLSSTLGDDLRVIAIERHDNKLKRGHLRGNRFTITVRDVPEGGLEKARATMAHLVVTGVPNAFGPQRFGKYGDNAVEARKILRKERPAPRDRRIKSLILSALQSEAFNAVLERRIARADFKALSENGVPLTVEPEDDTHDLEHPTLGLGEALPLRCIALPQFRFLERRNLGAHQALHDDLGYQSVVQACELIAGRCGSVAFADAHEQLVVDGALHRFA